MYYDQDHYNCTPFMVYIIFHNKRLQRGAHNEHSEKKRERNEIVNKESSNLTKNVLYQRGLNCTRLTEQLCVFENVIDATVESRAQTIKILLCTTN